MSVNENVTEPKRLFRSIKNPNNIQNDPTLGPRLKNACQEKLTYMGARDQQGCSSVARMPNMTNRLWL